MSNITHKALFDKLQDTYVIDKARQYAHWTLPALMADFTEVRNGRAVLERDYQEMGALLTNHLASKLTRLLFPANSPFFRIDPSRELKAQGAERGLKPEDMASAMARFEKDACKRVFLNASYAQLILALKHLIVTGNVLLYRDSPNKRTVSYGLQNFVVRRDGKGVTLDIVLKECTFVEALDEDLQKQLRLVDKGKYSRPEQTVEVYTRIQRKVKNKNAYCEVTQQVDTIPVGEPSTYPEYLCPWRVVAWSLIPGEHYGRGLVEDYAGGFAKLSDLSEAATLYGIEIMRVVHLVGAGSGTDIDDIASAECGEYVRGDPNSVAAHESGDYGKLKQVSDDIEQVTQRLSKAFMYQANTRDAERVTAYELQQDALEAEHALGGVYSSLAESMQMPLAYVLLVELKESLLEGLVSGELRLDISAGIPALGRSTDVQNLVGAAQEAAAIVPVFKQIDNRVDEHKLIDVIFAGRSVDTELIFKSKEQQQSEAAADAQIAQGQQQMQMAAAATDQVDALQSIQGPQ